MRSLLENLFSVSKMTSVGRAFGTWIQIELCKFRLRVHVKSIDTF